MTTLILSAFAPVFAMIVTGYLARVSGWLPAEVWPGVNTLNYRLLLPCFLFAALAQADFAASGLVPLALASGAASLLVAALAVIAARLAGLSAADSAPLVAVAALWNLVMFMALSARLFGAEAHAASVAVLGPGAIVGAALTVAAFALARRAEGGSKGPLALRRLALDPLVVGALAGLVANLTGLAALPLWVDAIALMGAGATAAILIAMGAGLEFDKLRGRYLALILAAGLRALIAPAVFLGLGLALGLPGQHVVLLTLAGGAPGAAIIYAIATDLNGQRPLTAGMLTASVLASALALPAFTALAIGLTGATP